MSILSGAFAEDSPGLPRGRGSLAADAVRDAQRPRILRAAITAFAEQGFAATTIADIVRRARVSRQAFYRQFDGKESCFLAAVDAGRDLLLPLVADAGLRPTTPDLEGLVRASVREYLRVSASEPEFTQAWTLELAHAGPAALRARDEYFTALAAAIEVGHAAFHRSDPEFVALPEPTYLALIGGCHELFYRFVAGGRCADLPELEEPMVQFLLTVLR